MFLGVYCVCGTNTLMHLCFNVRFTTDRSKSKGTFLVERQPLYLIHEKSTKIYIAMKYRMTLGLGIRVFVLISHFMNPIFEIKLTLLFTSKSRCHDINYWCLTLTLVVA